MNDMYIFRKMLGRNNIPANVKTEENKVTVTVNGVQFVFVDQQLKSIGKLND